MVGWWLVLHFTGILIKNNPTMGIQVGKTDTWWMIDDWIGDYTNQVLVGISDSANGEPRSQPGCLETEMTVDGCRSHCSVGVWWDDCSHRETYHGTYLKHGKKNIGIWQNMEFLLVFVIVNEKCHGNHVRRMPGLLLGWGKRFSIEGIAMELSSHIATENPSFIGDCFVNTSIWFLSIYLYIEDLFSQEWWWWYSD